MKSPSITDGIFPIRRGRLLIPVLSMALSMSIGLIELHAQTTGGNNVPPKKDIYELQEITATPKGATPLPIKLETYLKWLKKVNGEPEPAPVDSDIQWIADKGEPLFAPSYGATVELDFGKPFVKENTDEAKKVKVTATYSGTASVEKSPRTKDVDRIYLDFWIAETEDSADDVLIVRDENAQPAEGDKKVIHWAKVLVKHSAPSVLPLQLESTGEKKLYFYGEQQDPNQLPEDPPLEKNLKKEYADGEWFWISTEEKGTGQGKFKAKADPGTGYKDAPEEKTVNLLPVDLDIVHPATGALAEDREDGTNPTSPDGGYVSVKRTVGSDVIGGEDVTPITKLKIHAIAGAPTTWKTRVKFSGADRYEIYKDEERTEEALSEQTEFDATQTTTLYFQGLKKSLSRGGENITMQVKVGNNWVDGDSVKCTVVQSEFLIQIKAFIPYEWTEGEDVFPFPDPLLGKVAKGDFSATSRPTFKNAFSNKVPFYSVAPFRLCHEVILTPYVDLHYFYQDIEEKRQFTSAPSSDHYAKATSVDPTELALKNGYLPLTPPIDATGPPVLSPATYSPELSLYNSLRANKCALDLTGSGRDGALGIYTSVSPAIDWDVRLEIDSSSNPLQPSFRVKGKHDLYPAYEIITLQADGTFKDTHRHMPARNVLPGPESLFAAPSITFDNTGTISN